MPAQQITADHEKALEWARNQNFTSVSARYARLCAEAYDIERRQISDQNSFLWSLTLYRATTGYRVIIKGVGQEGVGEGSTPQEAHRRAESQLTERPLGLFNSRGVAGEQC